MFCPHTVPQSKRDLTPEEVSNARKKVLADLQLEGDFYLADGGDLGNGHSGGGMAMGGGEDGGGAVGENGYANGAVRRFPPPIAPPFFTKKPPVNRMRTLIFRLVEGAGSGRVGSVRGCGVPWSLFWKALLFLRAAFRRRPPPTFLGIFRRFSPSREHQKIRPIDQQTNDNEWCCRLFRNNKPVSKIGVRIRIDLSFLSVAAKGRKLTAANMWSRCCAVPVPAFPSLFATSIKLLFFGCLYSVSLWRKGGR